MTIEATFNEFDPEILRKKSWQMKSKAIWALTSALLVLSMSLAGTTAFADPDDDDDAVPGGRLISKIDYRFVLFDGIKDDEGRPLLWVATIEGDLSGKMKWWLELSLPDMDSTYLGGAVSYYAARWEIWIDGKLLLAGESAGKTVWPDGEDGIWDGHGVVTDATGKFSRLKGRKVYESGPVIYGEGEPFSLTGTGMFLIY